MKLNFRNLTAAGLLIAIGFVLPLGSATADETDVGDEQAFVTLMDGYLDLSREFVELASGRETTVFLALEGIAEIYEGSGEKNRAIEHLSRVMEAHPDNQVIKNLVRFKLKDIYVDMGQTDKALEMLDAVINENKS